MDFAFPALLILLLILPGVIYRYAYLRGLSINNPFVISSITDEIAYGLFVAAILHTIWSQFAFWMGHPVDFRAVLTLMVGSDEAHPEALQEAINITADNINWEVWYFLTLYIFSAAIGIILHEFVRRCRLDHKFQLLRFHHEWYYLLSGEYALLPEQPDWHDGEQPDMVLFSTVVNQGDKPYLYQGYIADYYFDRAGKLDRVVLIDAKRRLLEGESKDFHAIEGDLLIVKYTEMHTINIGGIVLAEKKKMDIEAT